MKPNRTLSLLGGLCLFAASAAYSTPAMIQPTAEAALVDTTPATDVAPRAEVNRLIAEAKTEAIRALSIRLEGAARVRSASEG